MASRVGKETFSFPFALVAKAIYFHLFILKVKPNLDSYKNGGPSNKTKPQLLNIALYDLFAIGIVASGIIHAVSSFFAPFFVFL